MRCDIRHAKDRKLPVRLELQDGVVQGGQQVPSSLVGDDDDADGVLFLLCDPRCFCEVCSCSPFLRPFFPFSPFLFFIYFYFFGPGFLSLCMRTEPADGPFSVPRLLRSLNARSVRDNRTNRRIRAEQRGDIHVNGCPETCARCKITDQKWNEMRSIMYDIQGLVVESSALTKEAKRLRRRDRAQLADWEAALAGFY